MPRAELDGGRGTGVDGEPGREFATYTIPGDEEPPDPGSSILVVVEGAVRQASVVGHQRHLFDPLVDVRVVL